jgi:predicted transcriptional regulator
MAPHLTQLQLQILELIRGAGARGMTCDEVEHWMGNKRHQTVSARVRELYLLGFIYRTTRTRRTRSGRMAVVYRVRRKRKPMDAMPTCSECGRTL